jgi:peptidyl-prolyl cis-trans isomerase A (cyclophilin A)
MIVRFLLTLALLSSGAVAQTPPPAVGPPPVAALAPPAERQYETVWIVMTTSLGDIVLGLESERAPLTTANFLRYIDQRRLDGTTFYRAMDLGRGFGLVQGGTKNDPRRLLPPVAHEPTTQTGLSHTDGTISLARAAPGSANADFFIVVGDLVSLDAQTNGSGDPDGFAAFGRVIQGMDIVRQIMAAPTSPTEGEGVMRGQMLSPVVQIVTVRRVPPPPVAVEPPLPGLPRLDGVQDVPPTPR